MKRPPTDDRIYRDRTCFTCHRGARYICTDCATALRAYRGGSTSPQIRSIVGAIIKDPDEALRLLFGRLALDWPRPWIRAGRVHILPGRDAAVGFVLDPQAVPMTIARLLNIHIDGRRGGARSRILETFAEMGADRFTETCP